MARLPAYVDALLRPGTFPHAATDLRLLETHVSWVVLAGAFAYKVKKPVALGFLDFSTTDRRVAACREEVRLNRRLCPNLYLGVSHLSRRNGCWVLAPLDVVAPPFACAADHPGVPPDAEPVTVMRRLPETGMLDHLLAVGAVGVPLLRRIARRLARFHSAAATGPGIDEHATPATVLANWEENFAQTGAYVDRGIIPAGQWRSVRRYVRSFLHGNAALLHERVAQGRVRDCHGDLHAGSVCVDRDDLYLFDCIEFSQRFRCGDVAAEVAFLAMDLAHHARADLATAFVDAYVRASADVALKTLLPFYSCYRAFVRGKVLCFRLDEPDLPAVEAAELATRARAYFDLAAAYALPGVKPVLVAVVGPPASGKTTIARAIASRVAAVHLSSDLIRKELGGRRPTDHAAAAFGHGLYSAAATRRTYAALRRRAARWLRAGHTVVLDATFGTRSERRALVRLSRRLRLPLVVCVCRADGATLRARLAARAVDPLAVSDARLELWPQLRTAYEEPRELDGRRLTLVKLNTTQPVAACVRRALAAVRRTAGMASREIPDAATGPQAYA